MKITVVGASGLIGAKVVDLLRGRGSRRRRGLALFVALVGAGIARFEPREASIAMFATAAAHAAVAIIAMIAGLGPTLPADAFFVAAWIASALLFHQASMASSPAI